MSRKPTAKDVAARAGVARSAVSMVVNGRDAGMVAPERRQRILDAAAELGYRPHSVGRSLRNQRTQTIGLVTDQIASSAFGGQLIRGATDVAMAAGYLLITVDTHGDADREGPAYEALLHREVDALMFAALSLREYRPPAELRGRPALLANCFDPDGSIPGVIADEVEGGRRAAQLLLDAGHRHVVALAGLDSFVAVPRRQAGIALAFETAGLTAPEVVPTGWDIGDGVEAATAVLSRAERPTALLCANDRVAAGVYLAAARVGLSVPEDVSVVGYDDDENIARHLRPALTTVALPHEEIGTAAMDALITHLEGDTPLPGSDILLGCDPVLRDSIAPPHP
ncbi:LacI family DNA-binding transcriptional regulator [Pseudactinotalea sp.]|uniref:LacI family DNA-binding transcriptional regulator n=1 Tax=Pseudactinotalea sp. TaxID=1926260 RepID=UPI003B3A8C01